MAEEKFLNITEVAARVRLTSATIYSLIKRNKFPRGVKIGAARRWNIEEIDGWTRAQAGN